MHEKVLLLKSPQNTKRHQILLLLREKKSNKCEIYQDKVTHFTNEPSMWRSFVKGTFVDDGDIQLVTNRFDRNTYCTVTHWSLSSKEFQFTRKKYAKRSFAWDVGFKVLKLQTQFSQNILFICCKFFSNIIYLFLF